MHATVRKTMVEWLLSEENPPDIKVYVTGHSMGGALATHCAMDLKVRGALDLCFNIRGDVYISSIPLEAFLSIGDSCCMDI